MDVRAWILILALVCFTAGTATGKLLTERGGGRELEPGPLADYKALLVSEFDLEPARARGLSSILARYELEAREIEVRYLADYRSRIETDLLRLGIEYNNIVRNKVLPPSQRERFDELASGRPISELPRH